MENQAQRVTDKKCVAEMDVKLDQRSPLSFP